MPISVRCPKCGHGYQLRDELAGKQAKCRCGNTISIPVVTTLSSLLDEEHIGQDPDEIAGPMMSPAAFPARPKSSPQFGSGFGRKKRGKDNTVAVVAAVVGVVAVLFAVLLVVFLLSGSQNQPAAVAPPAPSLSPAPASLPGQATPQETFASFKQAWLGGDWSRVHSLMTPEAQDQMTAILAVMGASLGPVCPELAAVAKQHGVDPASLAVLTLAATDPFADAAPAKPADKPFLSQMHGATASIKDKKAFFVAAMPALVNFLKSDKFAPIAQAGSQASGVSLTAGLDMLPMVAAETVLTDVSLSGFTASGLAKTPLPAAQPGGAQDGGGTEKITPMKFEQLSASWYIGPAL